MDLFLLLSSLGLGLRHGVDWDHIAAITDITGTEHEKRRAAFLAVIYAIGHGLAVLALGGVAIVLGDRLPDSVDPVMERVVGLTLLVLAVVLVRSVRRGQPISRGVLLFNGLQSARNRLRRSHRFEIEHSHADGGHPRHQVVATSHVHAVDVTRYTTAGAVAVGVLHGVGAETGTQALVLVSASRVTSNLEGVAILAAFVVGIVATTGLMALASAYGWSFVSRTSRAFTVVSWVTAILTGGLGVLYLVGGGDRLPGILA